MAFGPELYVIRDLPTQGKVDHITLGQIDPTDISPFPSDDPSYEHLNPYLARLFKEGHQARVVDELANNADVVVWGVTVDAEPLGFASLSLDERDNDVNYYSIVLHPNARYRGIGGLATEAVLRTAFSAGSLRRANSRFAQHTAVVSTYIHPNNQASQQMCERAGFVMVEGELYRMGDQDFLTYFCMEPSRVQNATILPG